RLFPLTAFGRPSLRKSWKPFYSIRKHPLCFLLSLQAMSGLAAQAGVALAQSANSRCVPSGGQTFFFFHHERKVTCKDPVSVICFLQKKERPLSTMSEASNYIDSSDYAAYSGSPPGRPSRPSKKIHNFGKRSNSIRRNPSAPVIKRNWLYKQDSTGMKLWKKRWFVLSDLCLFYYRDEKEEGILGSILLPSFLVSMLSVDDHVSRKYAFKATHSNMRTYYFCTDTAKEMESWMKVMTDAALVHAEAIKRFVRVMDKLKVEQCGLQEINHATNHRQPLTEPEIQNNKCNEAKDECIYAVHPTSTDKEERKQDAECYGFAKNGSEQDCAHTNINSLKLQPVEAKAIQANVMPLLALDETDSTQVNGSAECRDNRTPGLTQQSPAQETDHSLSRTSSRQQLELWVRTQRGRIKDDDARSVSSYQTLPRNASSHWLPFMPQYGDGYRSMPRNSMAQRDSICSFSPSLYEQALWPFVADKRRSMRDDTLWQLYEWQQRQAYNRQPERYSNMSSPKTMLNLSEHVPSSYSIPPSPSHGSLSMFEVYSPMGSYNTSSACSHFSSPLYSRDMSVDRRLRPLVNKVSSDTSCRNQIKQFVKVLNHVQCELYTWRFKVSYRVTFFLQIKLSRLCEQDKLVRIQDDKVQQLYREKHTLETALLSASQEIEMGSDNLATLQSVIQQRDLLQRGLLGTCRELSRVTAELELALRNYNRMEGEVTLAKNSLLEKLEALESPQTESPSQQYFCIQKELWQIEDVMEALHKHKAQRNAIDGMGFYGPKVSFNKHKNEEEDSVPPRPPLPQSYQPNTLSVPPLPSTWQPSLHRPEDKKANHRNSTHSGPDYRLYKSEPELTTVTEVDESNGEERADHNRDRDYPSNNGISYPVGIVPPRTKSPVRDSSSIASYVTLRNNKNADPRVGRPHSAVEQQLCSVESSRPRMSVEEQLERIQRHQQGALRGKKKSTRTSSQDNTSRSHSFTKLKNFDIQELEASFRQQKVVRGLETPAEEIARLKDLSQADHFNVDREVRHSMCLTQGAATACNSLGPLLELQSLMDHKISSSFAQAKGRNFAHQSRPCTFTHYCVRLISCTSLAFFILICKKEVYIY
uniref:Pleckstrin homology domain-containing family A member 5-like n=1 Tax=Gouania willdenowi TaxID=441366 RepID=A0A8C5G8W2_GOUWI